MVDNESEVKHAAIKNISGSLKHLTPDKIKNFLVAPLMETYTDSTPQFKAGTASALSEIAQFIGHEYAKSKVFPILTDLLKDENSEVKLQTVNGFLKIA